MRTVAMHPWEDAMPDSEFDRLIEAQKRGENVPVDSMSSSAELDTRRSKSSLGPSVFGSDQEGTMPGPAAHTTHDLAPGDVIFGDSDEGAIAVGPPLTAEA